MNKQEHLDQAEKLAELLSSYKLDKSEEIAIALSLYEYHINEAENANE